MKTVTPLNVRPRTLAMLAAPLAAAILMALPASSFAGIDVSVVIAPPMIPVYEQPALPGEGYIWTPGYWAYSGDDYFWVPGTWVRPPTIGFLWTPGYWAYDGGRYAFRNGYWGPHIGYYGGINYGYGYGGRGYEGGYWNHGAFYYNRNVNVIGSISVRNVYNKTVINNITINRVSFNGGPAGVQVRITDEERRADRDHHVQAVAEQQRHVEMASQNKELRASVNHGAPAIAATPKAGVFEGPGVVRAGAPSPAERDAAKTREEVQAKGKAPSPSAEDAAKPNDEAQAKANASNAPARDAAKSREDAQAKANASGSKETEVAKPREDAKAKSEDTGTATVAPKPRNARQPVEPKTTDATAATDQPQPRHARTPRNANRAPRENAADPSTQPDRTGQVERGNRPAGARQPERAARPNQGPHPVAQPEPREAKPHQPASSKKDDAQKQN